MNEQEEGSRTATRTWKPNRDCSIAFPASTAPQTIRPKDPSGPAVARAWEPRGPILPILFLLSENLPTSASRAGWAAVRCPSGSGLGIGMPSYAQPFCPNSAAKTGLPAATIPRKQRDGCARSSVGQSSCLLSRNRPSSPVFQNPLVSPPQKLPTHHLIPTHPEKASVSATSIKWEYQIHHRSAQLPTRHLPWRACGIPVLRTLARMRTRATPSPRSPRYLRRVPQIKRLEIVPVVPPVASQQTVGVMLGVGCDQEIRYDATPLATPLEVQAEHLPR